MEMILLRGGCPSHRVNNSDDWWWKKHDPVLNMNMFVLYIVDPKNINPNKQNQPSIDLV